MRPLIADLGSHLVANPLNLDRNQASHPVKQAVQDALKQRRK